MKRLVVLFLVLNSYLFSSNNPIKGKVVDIVNKKELPGANIIILNKEFGTASDEKGEFIIEKYSDENDILSISYVGYKNKNLKVKELMNNPIIYLEPEVISTQTILVSASVGKEGFTPKTFSKLDKETLKKTYTIQDMPTFLSQLPSVNYYSDAGYFLGYNYLTIRGFDQRRINVSINGIPQNDPEDHNVYWVDFPDLLANTEFIQVQRGAGSGMLGGAAIGGSVNIVTNPFSSKRNFYLSSQYGSYNTRKFSANYYSGLIDGKYSIIAKLSKTMTDGYRNRAWVDFNSYYLSAAILEENILTQLNFYGGPIADGLVYNGLPKFAIKDKKLRKENLSYFEANDNSYTFKVERRKEELENFSQPHYELLNEIKLTDNLKFNSALFYVQGDGFFDYDGSWGDTTYFRLTRQYGFAPIDNPSDVLIRAMVENKQWGWMPKFSFKHSNGELFIGGEMRLHNSLHWGSLIYGANLPNGITRDYRYYEYKGKKDILGFYIHENYNLNEKLILMGELQVAYNKYRLYDEKFVGTDFSVSHFFINPRLGANYKFDNINNIYASFSQVSREPRLKNYYDAAESSGGKTPQFELNANGNYDFKKPLVKPETMNNFEVGYGRYDKYYTLSVNFYYMIFKDEIVKNGLLDRFGQPQTGNMDQTIHRGVELSLTIKPFEYLEIIANGSASQNFISKGKTYVKYRDPNTNQRIVLPIDLKNNKIAGFPSSYANLIFNFNYLDLFASISAKYVGSYYSNNFDNKMKNLNFQYPGLFKYTDNKVEPYLNIDLYLSYEFQINSYINKAKLFSGIYNIANSYYAVNAVGQEFFPGPERNFVVGIELGL